MRAIVIVIDGLGIGALPDAQEYDDCGANTLAHLCEASSEAKWPTLITLGLGNCAKTATGLALTGCPPSDHPLASYGCMAERSSGKDSTTGHWEIAGIVSQKPFQLFSPQFPSFPETLVSRFERKIGTRILGNKAASGTEIIEELGEEHMSSGRPICYTSADSIFQIAAHSDVIPVEKLYTMCVIARSICDDYNISRVIARPFTGRPGSFVRTDQRKDYSIRLPCPSVMDVLQKNGIQTVGVGKIGDLFNESGLDESFHEKGNAACLERLLTLVRQPPLRAQFIFANLIDTDMLYGHRRDAPGFSSAVSRVDARLGSLIESLGGEDVLIITADHGCDPAFRGTDHTREYVPLIVYQQGRIARSLGLRRQFSDVAASLLAFFGVRSKIAGDSFFEEVS